ncbi:MAG: ankyrin repeat domain-containing protein [Armatimonadota bacterium]
MTRRGKIGYFITVMSYVPLLLFVGFVVWKAAGSVLESRADKLLVNGIERGNVAAVRQALANGADVEKVVSGTGIPPIQLASAWGRTDVIAALLDGGADIKRVPENCATPLIFAVSNGHLAAVKLLLSRGADAKGIQSPSGRTPQSAAATSTQMTDSQREEMAVLLQKAGATK